MSIKIENNPSFCVRAFNNISIAPHGEVKLCCFARGFAKKDGVHMSVNDSSLEDIWNSEYYHNVRQKMVRGEKLTECTRCYNEEAETGDSYRTRMNKDWQNGYLNRDRQSIDELVAGGLKDGERSTPPVSYDMQLGNICNFRCRMCSGGYSSRIAADPVQSRWRPAQNAGLGPSKDFQDILITRRTGIQYSKLPGYEVDTIGKPFVDAYNYAKMELSGKYTISALQVDFDADPNPESKWVIDVMIAGSHQDRLLLTGSPVDHEFAHPVSASDITLLLKEVALPPTPQSPKRLRLRALSIQTGERRRGAAAWHSDPEVIYRRTLEHATNLELLSLIGGEPMASKHIRGFLDRFVRDDLAKNIHLNITTNGTLLDEADIERFAQFKRLTVAISIDGIHAVQDYIRDGSNFEEVRTNAKRLAALDNSTVITAPTLQAYNVLDIETVFDFAFEIGALPRGSALHTPRFLNTSLLPIPIRQEGLERLRKRFAAMRNPEEERPLRLYIEHLTKDIGVPHDPGELAQFCTYTRQLDEDRGQSIADALPELHTRLLEYGVDV